jgi:hypothetical protein
LFSIKTANYIEFWNCSKNVDFFGAFYSYLPVELASDVEIGAFVGSDALVSVAFVSSGAFISVAFLCSAVLVAVTFVGPGELVGSDSILVK